MRRRRPGLAIAPLLLAALLLGGPSVARALQLQKIVATGDVLPGATQPVQSFGSYDVTPDAFVFGASFSPLELVRLCPSPSCPLRLQYPGDDVLWVHRPGQGTEPLLTAPFELDDGSAIVIDYATTRSPFFDSRGGFYVDWETELVPGASVLSGVYRGTVGGPLTPVLSNGDPLPSIAPPGGQAISFLYDYVGLAFDQPLILTTHSYSQPGGGGSTESTLFLGEPLSGGIDVASTLRTLTPSSSTLFGGKAAIYDRIDGGPVLMGSAVGSAFLATLDSSGALGLVVDAPQFASLLNPLRGARFLSDTEIVLSAVLNDATSGGSLDGLWKATLGGAIDPLLLVGDAVPGRATGSIFSSLRTFAHERGGPVWFVATTRVPGDTSSIRDELWKLDESGVPSLVLQPGDAVAGGIVGLVQSVSALPDGLGAVARVLDPTSSFLFIDSGGFISSIVRDGDDVVVGIGDTRTVRSASVLGLLGTDLVVSLDFTDGSEGYFLAIVPEPGTGVLVALGVAAVAIRRPRVVRGDSSGSARAAVSLARYASPW